MRVGKSEALLFKGLLVGLAAAGGVAAGWAARKVRLDREAEIWVEELLESRRDLLEPVENPTPIVEALVAGVTPWKVLASRRLADGDAFLMGLADPQGDVFYGIFLGLPPASGDRPDFEETLEVFQETNERAQEGDHAAIEACLNFRYKLIPVPDDLSARDYVRQAVEIMLDEHGAWARDEAERGPDQVLRWAERGYLFASPLVQGRERVAELE